MKVTGLERRVWEISVEDGGLLAEALDGFQAEEVDANTVKITSGVDGEAARILEFLRECKRLVRGLSG